MTDKRLYRSRKQRMLCGVCGGIGEYFNTDTTGVCAVRVHGRRDTGVYYSRHYHTGRTDLKSMVCGKSRDQVLRESA